jgi:hypothetical protein
MNIKVVQWKNDLDEITHAFTARFSTLSEADLNWKPNATLWSIAQIIDHLCVINSTYFPVFELVRQGKHPLPWHAHWPWLVRNMGAFILKSVKPETQQKIKTLPLWQPAQSNMSAAVFTNFQQHQAELKKQMEACTDLIDQGVVLSSPGNRSIVYTLETAFEIMVTHEKRHLLQAQQLLTLRQQAV